MWGRGGIFLAYWLALLPACGGQTSSDAARGDGAQGAGQAAREGEDGPFRDIDGGGVLDVGCSGRPNGPLVSALTEAEVAAMRDQACTGWVTEAEPRGASVFWVLDASESMNAPHPLGGGTKWEVARDGLIGAANALSSPLLLGMLAYPNLQMTGSYGDPSLCVNTDAVFPVAPLGGPDRRRFSDPLNAVVPGGCRPTLDAYHVALEQILEPYGAVAYRALMLATDGKPDLLHDCMPGICSDPLPGAEEAVIDAIAAAHAEHDVRTIVVGLAGSETDPQSGGDGREWLSRAAEAGGTSPRGCAHHAAPYCHLDLSQSANLAGDLAAALSGFVDAYRPAPLACAYALPTPPAGQALDFDAIRVLVWMGGSPNLLLRTSYTDHINCDFLGWYLDEETAELRFTAGVCSMLQFDPTVRIEILFGC